MEGIVTVSDVMEVIAGDLPERGQADEDEAIRREDGSWLIDGAMAIERFEDLVGIRGLREDGNGFNTVAGFVISRLGHIPRSGESIIFSGSRFDVVDMDGRRIDKILFLPARMDSDAAGQP